MKWLLIATPLLIGCQMVQPSSCPDGQSSMYHVGAAKLICGNVGWQQRIEVPPKPEDEANHPFINFRYDMLSQCKTGEFVYVQELIGGRETALNLGCMKNPNANNTDFMEDQNAGSPDSAPRALEATPPSTE